jgi:hypothetical protein
MGHGLSFRATAIVAIAYAVAMAYVEAAVVVYLERALGAEVGSVFPIRPVQEAGGLAAIEVGREAATLVMLGAVGVLAGRSPLERLAWAAVVFGAWDIGYYGWLYVFSGWPPSVGTMDLLFLIPLPWAGPVWSPVAVSVALVAVGLAAARSLREGRALVVRPVHWVAAIAGGVLIVASYIADAARLLDGGLPGPYPWPLFAAGMALALGAAIDVLRRARPAGRAPAPPPPG